MIEITIEKWEDLTDDVLSGIVKLITENAKESK
jgi:hypothetical protein